jgi:hypothetical protein
MLLIGGMDEAALGLDGMEESLHTNAKIVVMWSSILKSRKSAYQPKIVYFLSYLQNYYILGI